MRGIVSRHLTPVPSSWDTLDARGLANAALTASSSWGKPPDALYETLREHRFATAALSPLASSLLPSVRG